MGRDREKTNTGPQSSYDFSSFSNFIFSLIHLFTEQILTTFYALYLAGSAESDSKLHIGSVGFWHMFSLTMTAKVQKSKPSCTNTLLVSAV